MPAGLRTGAIRTDARSTFGFALLFAATMLWTLTPLARGLTPAGIGGRAAVFFICFASGSSSRPDALPGRPEPKHDRSSVCALCAGFCNGDAPSVARSGFIGAAPVQCTVHDWTVADCAAPTPRRGLSHRQRAPPVDFV